MKNKVDEMRDEKGVLPAFAWPGGYPIYYIVEDGGILCPKCANDYKEGRDNERQLKPVDAGINWEDNQLFCDHCNAQIEFAYETPEGDDAA